MLPSLVSQALASFEYVSVGAQDASRTQIERVIDFVRLAQEAGAFRVRIADTIGLLNPRQTHKLVTRLREAAPEMTYDFHGHNDLGMATANAVAAVDAGAQCVSVTVNGLGERAGNAALEEVTMAAKITLGKDSGLDAEGFSALSRLVSRAAGRPLHIAKPVVGDGAFLHESGIHCSGLVADRATFELIRAEEVGLKTAEFVVGKHSGSRSLTAVLGRLDLQISREDAQRLMEKVREEARRRKGPLSTSELRGLYEELFRRP
jgi:homocitrate synthase NifV